MCRWQRGVKLKPASFCLRHASRPAGFTARPPRASGSHAPRAPGDPHHLCSAARHPGADHPRPAGTAAASTQQSVSCVPALPHTPLFNGRGEQVSRHPPPNSLSPVFQPSAPLPPTSSGGGGGGDRSIGTYHPRVCLLSPSLTPMPPLFSGRGEQVSRHPPHNSLVSCVPALPHAPSLQWERRTGQ